ncbi:MULTISPECIES: ABC transporter ATP-binding protein [Sphingobacterium]|jgi:ABC-type multidrug transport system fused ATPase/permease subunit|uniref:ABC transporter ATP-binding protein n=1 Tax=Sphingobacterium TaxID=28453 RepID=UPI0004E5F6EA|nr:MULTISPECIES: ABC transporter ATP-binding protein [Sphingobacterium]UXD71726.1 ABC transporter ATP-binding protein/permease [Sphingobacterium faecium]WGQ15384.1 ABC transporter ATP-binding protein [Sphingobacterium faecium]CDS92611.1 ABC superfamily ATP binding cassette transporter, membrane protein [Sphingobacterium sp. PM2-P1-29]SJN52390.1 Lipid A export ATP-binding/permease protein MsbA [Sphingobacterium faecium PCAi_F2.5]
MTISLLFKKITPFAKPYKNLIFYTLILTLIGSFAAQINAFILKYTVDSISDLMVAKEPLSKGMHLIGVISGVLLVKEIVYSFIQFGQKFYGEKLRIFIARDFSQRIVEKILTYKMAFYTSEENESGKLQTRIDSGISSLTRLVQNFFIDILPLFANAIVALVCMFMANLYVGLVGLAVIPIYFYISQTQAGKLSGFRRQMRKYRESKNNRIINLIDSILVIKSFVREPEEADRHEKIQYEMTENQMQTRKTSFIFDSLKNFIEQIAVVAIIVLTAFLVLDNQITIGAIMFHIMLFSNVSAPIRQLHRIYDEVNDALIYSESFFEILESDDLIEGSGTFRPDQIKGHIVIEDVSFEYPNGTHALRDISFEIKPNQITALVGLSGAGKSTVINLLDKFYEPTAGRILLDGVDLKNYDTNFLRKNIGMVLQRNHIFKGSIFENIEYGKIGSTREEIIQAAKDAYIHEQIMELPQGYDSGAHLLSGGQQQRIAIARLFLKNPPIIFLDEPTANLDAIATEQIKNSLDAIKKDRTVIIVSHSISQIIDSNEIVVMEKGRVVEKGIHEDLYDQRGTYYKIFSAMANSLNLDKISKTLNH